MREHFGRLKDMKEGREFIFFPPPPSSLLRLLCHTLVTPGAGP
jgi:hypothetical protein